MHVECCAGGLLRSSLLSTPIDDIGLSEMCRDNVLSSVEEDTGAGIFCCDMIDAAKLILLMQTSLVGTMQMSEKNLAAVQNSKLHDSEQLDKLHPGDELRVVDLYSPETFTKIRDLLLGQTSLLPEDLGNVVREHAETNGVFTL